MDAVFRETVRRQGERLAVVGPGATQALTYEELDQAIDEVARGLAAAGIRPGDSIGLHWPSGIDYIMNTYAAWRLGASVVPIPVELVDEEKRQILRDIRIDAVLSSRNGAMFAVPLMTSMPTPLGGGDFIRVAHEREHPPGFAAVDAAFIRFTSGTTGRSKGVVLSHATILERIRAANEVLHVVPDDRVMWLLSMSYHFTVSVVAYLSFGATIILPRNHLADEVLKAAERNGATIIYGSPTHYAWMASTSSQHALPQLRLAISTTAPLDRETGQAFLRRYDVPIAQALGIIEVGLPFINVDFAAERPDSVGRLLPAYEMQLADAGFGPHCREICLSGPGCLDAYYAPWQTRDKIMADGWFHTGDVGELDDEACLYLRGRAKDVINAMGMKFFPHEVEAVLTSHPAVAEACILTETDARLGEVPYARIVLQEKDKEPPVQELIEHCRRRLASYKVPVRFEFVEVLAKTASGKILHRAEAPQPKPQSQRDVVFEGGVP